MATIRKRRVPVYYRHHELGRTRGRVAAKVTTSFLGDELVTPYGRGLALMSNSSGQHESGVWLDVEIRDSRPQCVAIRSERDGPEITADLLRFSLQKAVSELVRRHTVRSETD